MGHVAKHLRRYINCADCGAYIEAQKLETHKFLCPKTARRKPAEQRSFIPCRHCGVLFPTQKQAQHFPHMQEISLHEPMCSKNLSTQKINSLGKQFVVKPSYPKFKPAPALRVSAVITPDGNFPLLHDHAMELLRLNVVTRILLRGTFRLDWFKLRADCPNEAFAMFLYYRKVAREAGAQL